MKRFIKWAILAVVVLAASGFLAFLYFVPPLTTTPQEEFIKGAVAGAPSLDAIADPAERLLAERGQYFVTTAACGDCHTTPGPQGPDSSMYLAGGMKFVNDMHGATVTRNLTPDRETGLGTRSDEDIRRVLRSGIHYTGRAFSHRVMPWAGFSHWTEEDLRAVVVYLRHLTPVRHAIPDPAPTAKLPPGVEELAFAFQDYGQKK